jgi:hypothetical protein
MDAKYCICGQILYEACDGGNISIGSQEKPEFCSEECKEVSKNGI